MKNYYLKKDDIYSYFIKFQNNPNLNIIYNNEKEINQS